MGRTATFVMDGRDANIRFARTLVESLAENGMTCFILDLDALYSSNSDLIFVGPQEGNARHSIRVPPPGSDTEAEFSLLFAADHHAVVIDSLNSLYHLISEGNASTRGRKMSFALASLSQLARENSKAVILSMYRREGFSRSAKGRPISSLSDITASVRIEGGGIEISTERE